MATPRVTAAAGELEYPIMESLEERLLLSAYEVWGGYTNFTSEGGPPDWPSYLYSINQQEGYVKLGEADSTATFVGNYRYYVVVANQDIWIDAVQTSDGNYLGHNGEARLSGGNVAEWTNMLGAPDGQYAFFNGDTDSHGTYGAFVAFPNYASNTWDSWTGIRVIVEQPTSNAPDLVGGVEAVQSGIFMPGQNVPLALWYQNIGYGPVNQSFGMSIYLSHDRQIDGNDTMVFRTIEEGGLNVWQRVPTTGGVSVNARIPTGTASGRYYLIAVVDDTNGVGELREDNNVWVSAAPVILVGSKNDFNGDGKSDIVWRNNITGENCIWFMDGTEMIGGTHLPTLADQQWQMRGVGDFNADGQSDLLWRNVVTGQNMVWFISNGANTGGVNLPSQVDLNWDIVGVGDLNGDGATDILWRNNATGENLAWLMSQTVLAAPAGIQAEPDTNWQIVGLGDFNSNGLQDVLWRHRGSGDMRLWIMNGTMYSQTVHLPSESDLTWQSAGISDYNGDGTPDILWRNEVTGQNRVWLMIGENLAQTVDMYPIGDLSWRTIWQQDWAARLQMSLNGNLISSGQNVDFGRVELNRNQRQYTFSLQNVGNSPLTFGSISVPAGFSVIQPLPDSLAPGQFVNLTIRMETNTPGLRNGQISFSTNDPRTGTFIMPVTGAVTQCTDFTGDGLADLLWRNNVTGENNIWYMGGTNVIGGAVITHLGDLNWKMVGSGDFNGDGFNDIVWRNTTTGQNVVWFMQGATNIGGVELIAQQDLVWVIVAVADINGDGQHDLLWRNRTTGENLAWLMSGSTLAAVQGIRSDANLAWQIAGVGDFDRSGHVDILWRNRDTGENRIWLMQAGVYAATLHIQQEDNQNWQVGQVSDFNGDGIADILWRNENTGEMRAWLMAGGVLAQSVEMTTLADNNWKLSLQTTFAPRLEVALNGEVIPSGWQMNSGVVQAGETTETVTFTVTNTGQADMRLAPVTAPDGIVIVQNLPLTLGPGESTQLRLRVNSDIAGAINGQMHFASNDPSVGVFTIQVNCLVTSNCDFGGDGLADIVWRNTATGQNVVWFMQGATNIGGVELPTLNDGAWRIVGFGDFNGDGFCDLVWWNAANGSVDTWFIRDGVNIGGAHLGNWDDLNWRVVGVADLNNDGQDDILWRNFSTGENFAWLMSGTTVAAPAGIAAETDVDWEIVGTADFNRDSHTDIVWRNNSTGALRVWYMNGTTFVSSSFLPGESSLDWQVGDIDDYDCDGSPDIVWRNTSTGENRMWLMDGTNLDEVAVLPQLSDFNWVTAGPMNLA